MFGLLSWIMVMICAQIYACADAFVDVYVRVMNFLNVLWNIMPCSLHGVQCHTVTCSSTCPLCVWYVHNVYHYQPIPFQANFVCEIPKTTRKKFEVPARAKIGSSHDANRQGRILDYRALASSICQFLMGRTPRCEWPIWRTSRSQTHELLIGLYVESLFAIGALLQIFRPPHFPDPLTVSLTVSLEVATCIP